jgi:uncharacterized membrane protein required for colicin V production
MSLEENTMLAFITVVIMLVVAYAYFVEGLFTACTMFFNTFVSCVLAFNFFEPLADQLEELNFLGGYEDALSLMAIFSISLLLLRTLTNHLADTFVDFPEVIQRAGGAVFGLLTGYMVAGFLVCMFQTLPWDENFMGFQPQVDPAADGLRRYLPPDRVVLALMHRGAATSLSNRDDHLYSRIGGTFELRYMRFRRYSEREKRTSPRPYSGEFDPRATRIP